MGDDKQTPCAPSSLSSSRKKPKWIAYRVHLHRSLCIICVVDLLHQQLVRIFQNFSVWEDNLDQTVKLFVVTQRPKLKQESKRGGGSNVVECKGQHCNGAYLQMGSSAPKYKEGCYNSKSTDHAPIFLIVCANTKLGSENYLNVSKFISPTF